MLRSQLLFPAVAVCLIGAVSVRAEEAITIEQIKKAWDERSSKIKSVNAKWEVRHYFPAGGYNDEANITLVASGLPKLNPTEILPATDRHMTTTSRLVIDQTGNRFERTTPNWEFDRKDFYGTPWTSVFVNGILTRLAGKNQEKASYPDAMSQNSKRNSDIYTSELFALTTSIFGNDKNISHYPVVGFQVSQQNKEGSRILVDIVRKNSPREVETLTLDTSRGFLPVKITRTYNDKVRLDIRVTYEQRAECGWAPKEWVVKECNRDGTLLQMMSCKMTQLDLNTVISPDEFQVKLPSGTVLTKSTEDNSKRDEHYFVNSDGSLRRLSAKEIAGSYEDLLKNDQSPRRNWVAIICCSLTVIIVLVILRKRLATFVRKN